MSKASAFGISKPEAKFNLVLDDEQQKTVRRAYSWFIGSVATGHQGVDVLEAFCTDFSVLTIIDEKDLQPEYAAVVSGHELKELEVVLDSYQAYVSKTERPIISPNKEDHNYEWPYSAAGKLSLSVKYGVKSQELSNPRSVEDIILSNREASQSS